MKKHHLTIFISYLVLFCTFSFGQNNNNADFLFPLDINPSVSGSFAELRTNHFHSGIDLSTNGKTGLPVKSMDKGVVSRIKVSPVGYGNAIYIKHPNGYTTVYGHLNKYSTKIDSIITAEQYKIKSFAIDFFPKSDIKISKGEIIGYSGNSGSSGGPHLHYEVRDTETEEPMNPYFFQDKITDDVRPKILTIRVYPLDLNSSVNGEHAPKNYPVVFYDGTYHLKSNPKIYVSGKIGIGIEMIDYMSGSWKKCGVYKLNMKVDNRDYYSWELDRFSFAESRYINSHIDYTYKVKNGKRFERCFRQPGNKLSVYGKMENDGIIVMDTVKNIQINAADAAGNIASLKFSLTKARKEIPAKKEVTNLLSYKKEHFLKGEGISCHIPQGALYDNTAISLSIEKDSSKKITYSVGENSIPLHKSIRLAVDVPKSLMAKKEKVFIAAVSSTNRKHYAGGKLENDSIVLFTKSLGKYTLLTDEIAPTIRALQNIKGLVFNTDSKFVFRISDNFSGIKSYECFLNDKWALCEYDAKSNKLTCPLSKARVKKGENYRFKLVVTDHCGNQKTLESHFMVR